MDFLQLILRSLQLIFVIINLGLTAGLIVGQVAGGSPSSTNFVMFVAAWGGVTVIVGFAACFIYTLQGMIMAIIDGIAVAVYIIGAVLYAVKLGVHSCLAKDAATANLPIRYVYNPITNGGTSTDAAGNLVVHGNVRKQCQMAQADTAFMYFALACFIASLVVDFLGGRFSRRKSEEYA